jgi:hypothetical protein
VIGLLRCGVILKLTAPTLCWPSQLAIEFFQQSVVLVFFLLIDMTALVANLSAWHFSILKPNERQSLVPLGKVANLF